MDEINIYKSKKIVANHPPFGKKIDKITLKLVDNTEEQKVINLIRNYINNDPNIRVSCITKQLQIIFDKGEITMRKSKKIRSTSISKIISRYNIR